MNYACCEAFRALLAAPVSAILLARLYCLIRQDFALPLSRWRVRDQGQCLQPPMPVQPSANAHGILLQRMPQYQLRASPVWVQYAAHGSRACGMIGSPVTAPRPQILLLGHRLSGHGNAHIAAGAPQKT